MWGRQILSWMSSFLWNTSSALGSVMLSSPGTYQHQLGISVNANLVPTLSLTALSAIQTVNHPPLILKVWWSMLLLEFRSSTFSMISQCVAISPQLLFWFLPESLLPTCNVTPPPDVMFQVPQLPTIPEHHHTLTFITICYLNTKCHLFHILHNHWFESRLVLYSWTPSVSKTSFPVKQGLEGVP